jgi:hypothetical protein
MLTAKLHDLSGHLWKEVGFPPAVTELPKILIIHNNSPKGVKYFWLVQQTRNTYQEVYPHHINHSL